MRKILRKTLAFTCAAALALTALAGCSNGGGSEQHEPLTVCNLNGHFSDELLEAFQETHPEVEFDVSAYAGMNGSGYAKTSLEKGDIPDVYIATQMFSPEAQREHLIDLSGYGFINNYTATMLNDMDNEGGIYLLPTSYQMIGICYNKTLMEENGWEVPNSLEELEALAPEIEAAGYDVMRSMFTLDGFPFSYFFNIINTGYFHTAEGAQWKEDFPAGNAAAAGNEELLQGVEYFKRWVDDGLILASDIDALEEPKEAFMNGECVFYLSLGLSAYENTTEDGKTYEFGVMPWLSEDGSANTLTVSVPCYFGLSAELLEPGNEQKLEDALALMEYISTEEGQAAVADQTGSPYLYTSPLTGVQISEDSPFYELRDLVSEGHTVQLVYVGWEDLIIPMAQDIKGLISGDIAPEQLLEKFDRTYEATMNEGGSVLAVAEEDLTFDDTLKLCGIAMGRAVGADAALVTTGGYNEAHEVNDRGVSWYLYAGDVTVEEVNMFRNVAYNICVVDMTGAEIKELAAGGFDLYGTGNTFPYTLVTKGGVELEDDKTYRLAVGAGEFDEELWEEAEMVAITSQETVIDYVSTLSTFGPEDIVWE